MDCDKTECLKMLEQYQKKTTLKNINKHMDNIEKCNEYKRCIDKLFKNLMTNVY